MAASMAVFVPLIYSPDAAGQSPIFTASGIEGGGFQNAIAVSGSTIYTGADVAGIHKSANDGLDFVTSNAGLYTTL